MTRVSETAGSVKTSNISGDGSKTVSAVCDILRSQKRFPVPDLDLPDAESTENAAHVKQTVVEVRTRVAAKANLLPDTPIGKLVRFLDSTSLIER